MLETIQTQYLLNFDLETPQGYHVLTYMHLFLGDEALGSFQMGESVYCSGRFSIEHPQQVGLDGFINCFKGPLRFCWRTQGHFFLFCRVFHWRHSWIPGILIHHKQVPRDN